MTAQALRYPASRYRTEAPPDLGARAARERLSAPGLKAFFNIVARWKVRDEDARALLGGVSNGPFYEMKRNPDRMLDTDRLTRISYLVGIFKALHILHSRKLADEWMHLPNSNPIFAGETPLAYMIRGGLPAMQTVRRLLDARRAGMTLPPVALVRQFDTHRLVPSRHLPRATACSSRSRRRRASAGDLRARRRDQRSAARRPAAASGDRRRGAGVRRPARGGRQRRVLSSASARQPVQRAEPRRVVCGVRARDIAGRSRLPQVGAARRDRALRRQVTYDDYLADFSASFTTFDPPPRAALWRTGRAFPHARVSRSRQLRRVSGAGRSAPRGGIAGRGLSERPARGRDVRGLLQTGAGHECAAGENIPVHLGRHTRAGDISRAVMRAHVHLRVMRADDIPAGLRLCRLANWNQVEADWRFFLTSSPRGCHVAVDDAGSVIGTVATIGTATSSAGSGWCSSTRSTGVAASARDCCTEALALVGTTTTARLDATPAGT